MLKKKVDCIIQARMGSSRLPGKIFLEVNKTPLLQYLVDRVKKINNINRIIISTSTKVEDKKIVRFAKNNKIDYFQGNEKNVLDRIYKTAKFFKSSNILFITSDCPIFDINIADQIINTYKNNNCDYVNNNHIRSYPDGMDIQIFSFKILHDAWKKAKSLLEKEHVTLYIRKNLNKYKFINIVAPQKLFWPKLGLTIDEYADYILIKKIITYFVKKNDIFFSCEDIVNLLKKKKNWLKLNSFVERKGDT
jgi:spore coat polysaccharide biosynthesis protein SpsF